MKDISRRHFIRNAGLTLAVAATAMGNDISVIGRQVHGSSSLKPGPWLQITPDGRVTVLLCKSEMGQGIHTAIPMIVADELEADWNQVAIRMAPLDDQYADPVTESHSTYGSTSIRHLYWPLRKMGAAGREMLVEAAARRWKVPVGECEAVQSQVRHASSQRRLGYGELAAEASLLPVPENPPLKQRSQFRLMGKPVPRLDIPAKVKGEARYGIDTFVPGMLYAALARPPAYGASLTSYQEQAALQVRGVQQVVKTSRGIGVCAKTLEGAWRGRTALDARWGEGEQPLLSTERVDALLAGSLDRQGLSARDEGMVQAALEKGAKRVRAEYYLPYLSHAVMETMDCTAHVQTHRCDVWCATQNQSGVQMKAAQITGLERDKIHVHTPYLGGGFGRRGGTFVAEEALELSRSTGTPIKVIWTREEDMKHGTYRPGYANRIEASLDHNGRLRAWSHKVAASSVAAVVREGGGPPVDPFAVRALTRQFLYRIPNMRVEYVRVDTPIPVRTWRAPSGSHMGFAIEGFMDELAHTAGEDPVEFRLKHLSHDPRASRVVELAAEKAGWNSPSDSGRGRGISILFSDQTYVAEVAEVTVDRKTGLVRVHRIVCVVDCGPVVNPDTVVAQMEGAITMGLSAALKEKLEFARGGVRSGNFIDYPILRMSEAPRVEVHIVDSDGPVGGVGEPSLPPLAPAVANAVFSAVGIRLRTLPMAPGRVLEALERG